MGIWNSKWSFSLAFIVSCSAVYLSSFLTEGRKSSTALTSNL